MSTPTFDPHTSKRVDKTTGTATSGSAERERYIAEVGGLDKLQEKVYQQGVRAGHAQGYQEGYQDGFQAGLEVAAEAVCRILEPRLTKIEQALRLQQAVEI